MMAEMQAKEKGYTIGRGFSEIWHYWRLDRTGTKDKRTGTLNVREGMGYDRCYWCIV
jgi:hypothetical protein